MEFVIIPAYNEEKTIREVVLRSKKQKVKVVVVNDGSVDTTPKIVKKLGVVLINHKRRKGKGEAIKTGLKYVIKNYPKAKYMVLMDADLQYLPEDIPKILNPLKKGEADIVMGYRNWKKIPFRHRIGNFVWRKSFNLLFGTDFKDTNCGFIGLNKRAAEKIVNVLRGGYIIENTILASALKNKLKIKQVPITVIYKKKSKILRGVKMVLGVLMFILKEGFKYRFYKGKNKLKELLIIKKPSRLGQ